LAINNFLPLISLQGIENVNVREYEISLFQPSLFWDFLITSKKTQKI